MASLTTALPLIGRILIALLFVLAGIGKLANPAGTIAYIASAGLPFPPVAYGVALAVEILGGLAIAVGFRTRPTAIVLAVFTVAAAVGFHSKFGDQNMLTHFLKNLAITGGLLQLVAHGGGAFSLDNRRA